MRQIGQMMGQVGQSRCLLAVQRKSLLRQMSHGQRIEGLRVAQFVK